MKFLVLGAGMMGTALVHDLVKSKVDEVIVADGDIKKAKGVADRFASDCLSYARLNMEKIDAVAAYMRRFDCVISAVPYFFNARLAKAAIECKAHFCDLGGNNDIVARELKMNAKAKKAGVTVVPDCGLAPGMTNVMVAAGLAELGKGIAREVHIRVGGLPVRPIPPLNYKLVFSPYGLINEYVEKAVILRNGKPVLVESMTDIEKLEFPKPFGKLEAFYTSGGTSTLPQTLSRRIKNLDYKTIRYPGHCNMFKVLINLGLTSKQKIKVGDVKVRPIDVLARSLENMLINDDPDGVLVRVVVKGSKKEVTYQAMDGYDEKNDMTAMMRTTSYPTSIIAQMMVNGDIEERGVIPPELAVPHEKFISELKKRNIFFKKKVREL
jgi:lysine 6-dehydrogenase